jgi:hypothetical protein
VAAVSKGFSLEQDAPFLAAPTERGFGVKDDIGSGIVELRWHNGVSLLKKFGKKAKRRKGIIASSSLSLLIKVKVEDFQFLEHGLLGVMFRHRLPSRVPHLPEQAGLPGQV